MEQKKLLRSKHDRKLAGVCAGVANYLNVDTTIIRLIWAIACIGWIGIIVYLIAWFVIPEEA